MEEEALPQQAKRGTTAMEALPQQSAARAPQRGTDMDAGLPQQSAKRGTTGMDAAGGNPFPVEQQPPQGVVPADDAPPLPSGRSSMPSRRSSAPPPPSAALHSATAAGGGGGAGVGPAEGVGSLDTPQVRAARVC